jgi:hypothetical protein
VEVGRWYLQVEVGKAGQEAYAGASELGTSVVTTSQRHAERDWCQGTVGSNLRCSNRLCVNFCELCGEASDLSVS